MKCEQIRPASGDKLRAQQIGRFAVRVLRIRVECPVDPVRVLTEIEVLQHLRKRSERCIAAHDGQRQNRPLRRLSGNAAQALERCIARRKEQISVFQFPRLLGEHVRPKLLPADKRFSFSGTGIIREERFPVPHQQPSVRAQAKPDDLRGAGIGLQRRKRIRREFAQLRQLLAVEIPRQDIQNAVRLLYGREAPTVLCVQTLPRRFRARLIQTDKQRCAHHTKAAFKPAQLEKAVGVLRLQEHDLLQGERGVIVGQRKLALRLL